MDGYPIPSISRYSLPLTIPYWASLSCWILSTEYVLVNIEFYPRRQPAEKNLRQICYLQIRIKLLQMTFNDFFFTIWISCMWGLRIMQRKLKIFTFSIRFFGSKTEMGYTLVTGRLASISSWNLYTEVVIILKKVPHTSVWTWEGIVRMWTLFKKIFHIGVSL